MCIQMKIYVLPVSQTFQPEKMPFQYPPHNKDSYGVEQDFLNYLLKQDALLTKNPNQADWHYLPIFWSRYHYNHNFGKTGVNELKKEIEKVLLDERKTFTICQYPDGPLVDLGQSTLFLSSRKSPQGIDIPLLCTPHQSSAQPMGKKYHASFVGHVSTHPIRTEMVDALKNRKDIFIHNGNQGTRFFVHKILESYISLCPRGYGGSSFRFYESMQLGIAPFMLGDLDVRPFKKYINWEEVSYFSKSVSNLSQMLDSIPVHELVEKGKKAAILWKEKLTYQKWCQYVCKELEDVR